MTSIALHKIIQIFRVEQINWNWFQILIEVQINLETEMSGGSNFEHLLIMIQSDYLSNVSSISFDNEHNSFTKTSSKAL